MNSPQKFFTVSTGLVRRLLDRRPAKLVARYLIPAHISLVDLLLVSPAKSPRSMQATERPREAASRAAPEPVAPAPIIRTSKLGAKRGRGRGY